MPAVALAELPPQNAASRATAELGGTVATSDGNTDIDMADMQRIWLIWIIYIYIYNMFDMILKKWGPKQLHFLPWMRMIEPNIPTLPSQAPKFVLLVPRPAFRRFHCFGKK